MGAALTRPTGIVSALARYSCVRRLTISIAIGAAFGHGTRTRTLSRTLTGREASKCAVRARRRRSSAALAPLLAPLATTLGALGTMARGPTVAELRTELGKRKLPTTGLKGELEQRLRDADEQAKKNTAREKEAKRMKTTVHSIADEYLCPITQELPIDPVMAEDGRIYERLAIMEWLGRSQQSPITREPMGTKLIRSPQVRNTLERLVTSGAITGDKVTAWKNKLKDEKKLKELRAKAEHDPDAMYKLGLSHYNGWLGLPKSSEQSRACYKRGAALHDVKCMASYGESLTKGLGGEPLPTLGIVYTTRAAEAGSNLAAHQLGMAFLKGKHGLPEDSAQAKYWLGKVADGSCPVKTLKKDWVETAKNTLNTL